MALLIFFSILLLIGLPLGQLARISPQLSVSVTPLDALVGGAALVWVVVLLIKRPKSSRIAFTFFLFEGVLLLSLAVNAFFLPRQQVGVAFLYLLRFTSYVSLFFITKALPTSAKQKMKYLLMGSGLLLLLTGYIQFLWYPSLRNLIYEGWDEHFYRMFGTFLDPNFFGLFLVCFFLFVVSSALYATGRWAKVFFSLLSLLTMGGIILSYSRTALLALFVGIAVLFWRRLSWQQVALGLCVVVVLSVGIMGVVGRRAEGNDLLRRVSTEARIGNATNALTIFMDNPLVGIGFNAYRYAQYRHGFMKGSPTQEDHGASGADNSFLFVLATSGIVGFAAFLYYWWAQIQILLQKKQLLALATLVAWMVGSCFIDGMFYPSLMVWVLVLIGISQ